MNHNEHKREQHTRPMYPNVEEEKPGNCPECGMNLVPEKKIKN